MALVQRFFVLAMLLAFVQVESAWADRGVHLRVVLDTSMSMRVRLGDGSGPNDTGRLAILATMLLYDLVDPNPLRAQHPDSFVVLPFYEDWPRDRDLGDSMPTEIGTPIQAISQDEADRERFWQQLHALPYDAKNTYFYPGLRAALDQLIQEAPDPDDRRIIVMLTDGLPETLAKDREQALLLELQREFIDQDIQFYLLAFGPTAAREREFLETPFQGPVGERLGSLFIDPTGSDLVLNMAELFSRGFGYLVDHIGPGPRSRDVDLDGNVTPPEVKVLALRRGGGAAPSQTITPDVNNPRGVMTAREVGAAYSIQSIEGLHPDQHYRLTTDVDRADVAILRKVQPELGLIGHAVEHDDGRQPIPSRLDQVVAETPFIAKVLVQSPTGTSGRQAALDIQFRTLGPRIDGACKFAGVENYLGPIIGSRQRHGDGESYEIRVVFPENSSNPAEKYRGHIEVTAKLEGQEVGTPLNCERAHGVDVYPKIAIRTVPRDGWLEPSTLTEAEQGCVTFDLAMDDPSRLAILQGPPIRLRAYLEPSEPGLADGALAEASFLLDGEPIGWQTDGGTPWYAGRDLNQDSLLGTHRLCVTVGDPNIDAPSNDLGLRVRMQLDHTPYDDFRVVSPFEAKLRVVPVPPPSFADFPWDILWWLLAALLAALLALRQLAPRLPMADDLGYELRPAADAATLADETAAGAVERAVRLESLPAAPWWARALGLSPARALHDPTSDRVVVWLKPVDTKLFALRPAQGLRVAQLDGTDIEADRGLVQVKVQHDYLLRGNAGRWRLRLGYRRDTTAPSVAATPDAGHSSPVAGH